MRSRLKLLPKDLLIKTNPIDHADWNYKPLLGYIQRKRFQLILSLMGNNIYNETLEIGYGSGIFMPMLSKYSKKLYGIDRHSLNEKVSNILVDNGIVTSLYSGSVSEMPFFANGSFDLIVSVSTFEFIEDKKTACLEIRRVLKKDGKFILVTPGDSWILDLGLKILTKETAKKDYGEMRQQVLPVLKENFNLKMSKSFPSFFNGFFAIYNAYYLTT